MKEYAECFRNNLKPNQCGMSIPKEEGIERINVVIFMTKKSKNRIIRINTGILSNMKQKIKEFYH